MDNWGGLGTGTARIGSHTHTLSRILVEHEGNSRDENEEKSTGQRPKSHTQRQLVFQLMYAHTYCYWFIYAIETYYYLLSTVNNNNNND